MSATLKTLRKYPEDERPVVVGAFVSGVQVGCAWETTVVPGLFNWAVFGGATGYGYARGGYSLKAACDDLLSALNRQRTEEAA